MTKSFLLFGEFLSVCMRFAGNFEKWKQKASGWDSVARSWDTDIKDPNHFVNFEDGYKKFAKFESDILREVGPKTSGIDIGCGTGSASALLTKYVKQLYLLDISNRMLKISKTRYPSAIVLYASGTDIPLEDQSIDIAISRGIIVSLVAYKKEIDSLLDEIHRILKPGGAIILDFLSNKKTVKFKAKESYKKAFTRSEMESLLKERKFYKIRFDGSESARVIRVCAMKAEL